MLECGIGKSAKEELEDLLEPLDADYPNKIKQIFNKALIEHTQKAASGQIYLCSQYDTITESSDEPVGKNPNRLSLQTKKTFLKDMGYPSLVGLKRQQK